MYFLQRPVRIYPEIFKNNQIKSNGKEESKPNKSVVLPDH